MGGFALPIFAIVSTMSAKSKNDAGKASQRAYDMEATQAKMEGQAQSNERLRALNEALSTQQAMFGAQGRMSGSGSTLAIQQGDIGKAKADVEMIKSGAKSNELGLKIAGKTVRDQARTDAVMSAGESLFKYSQLGG